MRSLFTLQGAFVALLALSAWSACANRYIIVRDDSLDGASATAVNDKGQMSGNAFIGHVVHGMFYRRDGWERLGPDTWATSLNNAGDVGGHYEAGIHDGQGFIWPKTGSPIRIDAGVPIRIAGLNDDRVALGTYVGSPRSFVWTRNGGLVDLGLMGEGTRCEATAISNAGQVTGRATVAVDGRYHAFIWKDGQFQDLGRLRHHDDTEGHGINIHGDVVGYATAKDGTTHHAFHWNGARMIPLDPQGTFFDTEALAINDRGEIVGIASHDRFIGNPARFADGKVILLSEEVENLENWDLQSVAGINNHGVIVGNGNLGGFMLIPQEPQDAR